MRCQAILQHAVYLKYSLQHGKQFPVIASDHEMTSIDDHFDSASEAFWDILLNCSFCKHYSLVQPTDMLHTHWDTGIQIPVMTVTNN